MKVLNLGMEKGVVMGVAFSPVLVGGCWVGEGRTSDERALARFRSFPERFVMTEEVPTPLVITVTPPLDSSALVSETKLENVLSPVPQGFVWPQAMPENAVEALTAAQWILDDVRAASDAQLEALPLIGKATVKKIREALV